MSTSLAVWNFNSSTTLPQAANRTASGLTSNLTTNFASTTSFTGTTVNADSGDAAVNALGLTPGTSLVNNGRNVSAAVTTTGYGSIQVSFAIQGTSTGFTSDQFEYSTDGTTFTAFGAAFAPPTSFAAQTFNLSSISALNNDANAKFLISFSGGSASGGNNRLDNLVVSGTLLAPVVSSIYPASGPAGTAITITGTGLASATSVTFNGSNAVASFTSDSSTQLVLNAPTLPAAGVYDLQVNTALGTSAIVQPADQYTFTIVAAGSPTVTGIAPTNGPYSGGESVVITGTNFSGTPTVNFNTTPGTAVVVNSTTSITVTEPAGTLGSTVDVTVTNSNGTSPVNAGDQFTYTAPTVSALTVTTATGDTGIATQRTATATVAAESTSYSIPSVAFYLDLNRNGAVDAGDTSLGSATVTGGVATLNFTPSLIPIGYSNSSGYSLLAVAASNSGLTASKSATFFVKSPQLQFSPTNYSTNQSAGSVTLTVTRTLDTTEAIQVTYNTSDGTAKAGTDYNATTGTLYFPANASVTTDSETFTIPLKDSSIQPGVISFTASLSNGVGSNSAQGSLDITTVSTPAIITSQQTIARAFTPGDVVIERIGDGSSTAAGSAVAIFLDEYSPGGTMVQSIPLQSSGIGTSGTNQAITANPSSATEGFLTVSEDGHYLLVPGYAANAGTGSITGSTVTSGIYREVGIIPSTGIANTTNTFNWASSDNPRTVASVDGTRLYLGASGGVKYVVANGTINQATGSINTSSAPDQIEIYGNNLYVSGKLASSALRVAQVGSGLPTTSGQTATNLPGISNVSGSNPSSVTPYAFFLTSDSGSALDTLYIADQGRGIDKYSLVSGSWVYNNTIGGAGNAIDGLTGIQNGTSVTLFATADGTAWTLTDSSGYDATDNGSLSTIVTAPSNETLRGVALVPQPFLAPGITSLSSATGPAAGTNVITITGANFSGGSVVMFGPKAATSVTYVSSTQLSVVAPSGSGTINVTVTTPGGNASTPYTYTGLPAWLSPSSVATYDAYAHVLTVTGSAMIIGDPLAYGESPITTVTGTGSLNVTPASGSVVHLASLNESAGAVTALPGSASSPVILVLTAGSTDLTLASTSTLDLGNGYLDLVNSNQSSAMITLTQITQSVASGYNGGSWAGNGITSTTAAGDATHLTSLGVMENTLNGGTTALYSATAGSLGKFDGIYPAATDVLVRYTYVGDANLTGKTDGSDYSLIDASHGTTATGWFNGDFNYDNSINGSDYTLLDNAFNTQGNAFTSTMIASPMSQLANGNAKLTAASLMVASNVSVEGAFSEKKIKHHLVDLVLEDSAAR